MATRKLVSFFFSRHFRRQVHDVCRSTAPIHFWSVDSRFISLNRPWTIKPSQPPIRLIAENPKIRWSHASPQANVVTSWSDLVAALKLNPLTRFDLNILYINIELAPWSVCDPGRTGFLVEPRRGRMTGMKKKGKESEKRKITPPQPVDIASEPVEVESQWSREIDAFDREPTCFLASYTSFSRSLTDAKHR